MKLFTTITSERGKTVTKSGNEFIEVRITDDRKEKYQVFFSKDGSIRVFSHDKGKTVYFEK